MRELVSWWRKKQKIETRATGRLGDVTKLLQTPRRETAVYAGFCQGCSFAPIFRRTHKVGCPEVSPPGNFEIIHVAIAVKTLLRKKCDTSTSQSNNFDGVSRKRFKPSTPSFNKYDTIARHNTVALKLKGMKCCQSRSNRTNTNITTAKQNRQKTQKYYQNISNTWKTVKGLSDD